MTNEQLDEIIDLNEKRKDRIIPMMQAIQAIEGFVSDESVSYLSEKLGLDKSFIYSTASFYEFFRFEKKGKYIFTVCDGTTCYSHKSLEIIDALYKELGITKENNTTADGLITVETVPCLGACGRGPNMKLNGHIFTHMTPELAVDYIEMIRLSENEIEEADDVL